MSYWQGPGQHAYPRRFREAKNMTLHPGTLGELNWGNFNLSWPTQASTAKLCTMAIAMYIAKGKGEESFCLQEWRTRRAWEELHLWCGSESHPFLGRGGGGNNCGVQAGKGDFIVVSTSHCLYMKGQRLEWTLLSLQHVHTHHQREVCPRDQLFSVCSGTEFCHSANVYWVLWLLF